MGLHILLVDAVVLDVLQRLICEVLELTALGVVQIFIIGVVLVYTMRVEVDPVLVCLCLRRLYCL